MARALAILVMLCAASAADAGIYPTLPDPKFNFNQDGTALPLPADVFLIEHSNRSDAMNPSSSGERAKLRNELQKQIEQKLPKVNALKPGEVIALTADLMRVGNSDQALKLLLPRSRERNPDYRLMANLVQAYALAFDWDSAYRNFDGLLDAETPVGTEELAWRVKTDRKYVERWLQYHRRHPRATTVQETLPPINLFGNGPLPPDAVAIVQQMALDAPNDMFLVWELAETTAKVGDYRTASALFDRCTNSGLTQPKALRDRRIEVQELAAKMPKVQDPDLLPMIEPPSPPPAPKGLFDLVDPKKFWLLAGSFAAIVMVLLGLQIRSIRRKRRRRNV